MLIHNKAAKKKMQMVPNQSNTHFIMQKIAYNKRDKYLSRLNFEERSSPTEKYFNSEFSAGNVIAHVPCFSHSCFLQKNNNVHYRAIFVCQ